MTVSTTDTVLRPDYRLAMGVLIVGAGLGLLQVWLGLIVGLLGLFLTVQTRFIRLKFTSLELQVLRGESVLRQFPYDEWLVWTIFWDAVPILFYFREVNSIHFLPMLFNPKELKEQLQRHCAACGQ